MMISYFESEWVEISTLNYTSVSLFSWNLFTDSSRQKNRQPITMDLFDDFLESGASY